MMQLKKLFGFRGGVNPPELKSISNQKRIETLTVPPQLIVPIHQHIGSDAVCLVEQGQKVLKGQKIARADGYVSAAIHAPSSGTVVAIEDRPVPHPSGLKAQCIVIECDGKDQWISRQPIDDYASLAPSALRNHIRESGIVGLGGAGFPSFIKMNPGTHKTIDTLILNAAECEPYITCDDMLLRERAHEIIQGGEVIRHAVQAKRCVLAVEDNKTEAIDAIKKAVEQAGVDMDIAVLPSIYPAGSEKQLVYNITGKEIPSNGLPLHIGVVLQNVGTAAAVYRAVFLGEPLISRIVTLSGQAAANPGNYQVLFGTPIETLIEVTGGDIARTAMLVMGGPMMGISILSPRAPVIKTTNCIIAAEAGELFPGEPYRPCIRCGACAEVCPVSLLPQHLFWHAKSNNFDKAQEYQLFDCIECGCCSYVCPSRIPLVQFYRYAKTEIWAQERERKKSDWARERFEFRKQRLEEEKRKREEKLKQRRKSVKKNADPTAKSKAIEEAVARAKNKKRTVADQGDKSK